MSEILIHDNHCALILSKEEALVIYALVGKLPCGDVKEAARIFNTFHRSDFISWGEYVSWWDNHVIEARRDIECKAGGRLPDSSILIVNKK